MHDSRSTKGTPKESQKERLKKPPTFHCNTMDTLMVPDLHRQQPQRRMADGGGSFGSGSHGLLFFVCVLLHSILSTDLLSFFT